MSLKSAAMKLMQKAIIHAPDTWIPENSGSPYYP